MKMTKREILQGVENLRMIPQSNPTLGGMRIVIGALRDYAKEADKIGAFDLRDELLARSQDMENEIKKVLK